MAIAKPLADLVGTQLQFQLPRAAREREVKRPPELTWEVVEQLEGDSMPATDDDLREYGQLSLVSGKFLCRQRSGDRMAFLRVDQQIPMIGTESYPAVSRAAQALQGPFETNELRALKQLTEGGCPDVPRLLGYKFEQQDATATVPGGFKTFVLWEKVPGESIEWSQFWSYPYAERQEIREIFKSCFQHIVAFDYLPGFPDTTNLIYDRSTKQMHISGFNNAARFRDSKVWSDGMYVTMGLVLSPPSSSDIYFPIQATDLRQDETGCRW
ncbi:unnamed protein product [Penicillium olsonii]|nr:unnamed protein product [Penicillium olsonii]